ncbi:MAG: L-seryl-tRNA(Sec) selenium transferase [Geodermatophilaceae bacterium]|nr:L-seryl-tRNA(Sec) selenium transferase [Geodermatophilaceae bacterium]
MNGPHYSPDVPDRRRLVPRTDAILADPRLVDVSDRLGRERVKAAVAGALQQVRDGSLDAVDTVDATLAALPGAATSLRPVLNATGVVLHTNLGRAPLSAAAVDALRLAAGVTDVELDLGTGNRGHRGRGTLAALAAAVPAAGDVLLVNNAAAALVLVATALAGMERRDTSRRRAAGIEGRDTSRRRGAGKRREIVISRGEMVEIGDGFRLPDLLQSTGARLREVGTTNRVTPADYRDAIGPQTGFVLKVHPSNFVVTGFTADVPVAGLTGLGVPVVADIGSGLLRPDPLLPAEPDVASTLRDGADLVVASGDKLLGGPQAGLLLGRADLVHTLRRHPLARALRVDKLTLAAMEATLNGPPTPTHRALHADVAELRARAERIAAALAEGGIACDAVDSVSAVGGGGAPGVQLPSAAVALPGSYAVALRAGTPAVLGRVERERCLLDLRAVAPEDDDALVAAVRAAR